MAPNPQISNAPTQSSVEAPGLGRLVGIAASIIVTSVFLVVAGGLYATGTDLLPAMGIAFFAAAWGGGGFSAMIGGVIYATRLENEAIAARVLVAR
ncbi:MAG: hypothetical protein ABI239_02800 [Aquihabitans sp.]